MKDVLLIFLFLFLLIGIVNAEEIHLLCLSFAQGDSIKFQQQFAKIDSLKNQRNNFIIISTQKPEFINLENFINIFSPEIFFEVSDTNIAKKDNRKIISSNLKFFNEEREIKFFHSEVIILLDTLKIGIMGIVTPDFPHLYPELSKDLTFRFDIFNCAKEVVDSLRSQNTDIIISLNYLGNFLDKELIKKVPEIDFVIDYFETNYEEYYIHNPKHINIIHINFKQPSVIDICLQLKKDTHNMLIIDSLSVKLDSNLSN
ncbi:MAG: hypothetical protein KAW87_08490 [Candidatus Cloacimonetes bacterium]|nr:hypothetical protein [Candidatus Cloacimonadota bacterium]